jgi:hypothetical protein
MKLIKSLLLGTAAGFAATAGVQAADLPSRKAAPVDYVRVCTIGSFTGFVIPGSDICLKVGGFVRVNYVNNQTQHGFYYLPGVGGVGVGTFGRGYLQSSGGFNAVASIKMDARQTTEYGLLRSFFDVRVSSVGTAGIDKAYIQFGPWSFGKFQSFFDFYADDFNNITGVGSDNSVVGAAYTYNAGNGFFATLALEDRYGTASSPTGTNNFLYSSLGGVFAAPTVNGVGTTYAVGGYGGIATGGYRTPDAVVSLLYDPGTWGKAQLSGALHNARTFNAFSSSDNKLGWAVQAGVNIKVPMLGASDAFVLQGGYTEGALSYIGANNTGAGIGSTLPIIGYADAVAIGPGGSVKATKGYDLIAAFDHYWAPNFDTSLQVAYTKVDYSNGGLTGTAGLQARDFSIFQAGVQATWVPVKGLKFAGTVNYYQVDAKRLAQDVIGGAYAVDRKSNGIQTLIRVQRDF